MLYIVLVLVLAALGLLVTALITASSLWAWVSIGLSVLAGLILVFDWVRRRRRATASVDVPEDTEADAPPEDVPEAGSEAEQTALLPAAGDLGDPADTPESAVDEPAEAAAPEGEPGEEPTPAEDVALLSDLDDEVVVVDEYPHYHLASCTWVGSRDTIPIGVGEARQLGFTPCARCTPDAALVALHR